ncbi:MAG: hypothetical protein ACXWDI_16510 [Nocardioides sp.]
MNTHTTDTTMTTELRSVLLELARRQDDLAAHEAAATPYWTPCAPLVLGRRSAAAVLRAEADYLVTTS